MTVGEIDLTTARQLLQRMCKAISLQYRYKVELHEYANGHTYIITVDNEIPFILKSTSTTNEFISPCYANDCKMLLKRILMPYIKLVIYPLGKDKIEIDLNKMFGSSIEEIEIQLDLLNV